MIFLCGNCQAKYQLPDERVAGRTVRMKCRKCAHVIEVTGPSPAQEPAAGAEPNGWYAGIDGQPTGPMSEEDLAGKLAAGVVTGETLVWREGLDGWKPLSAIGELSSLLASAASPPAPEPDPEPIRSFEPPVRLPEQRESAVPRTSVPAPRSSGFARPTPPRAVPSSTSTLFGASAAARKLDDEPATVVPVAAAPNEEAAPPSSPAPVTAADEPLGPSSISPSLPSPSPAPVTSAEEPSALASVPAVAPSAPAGDDSSAAVAAPLSTAAAAETTTPTGLENGERASLAAPLGAVPSAPPPASERAASAVVPVAPSRSRVHPAAWALVGLGGVLVGVVAGISLAKGPQETPSAATTPVASVEAPQAPVASAEPAPVEEPPTPTAETTPTEADEPSETTEQAAAPVPAEPTPVQKAAATKSAETSKTRQAAAPQASSSPKTAPTMGGLSSLSGLAAGPAPGPSKTSSTGGGGALSQAEVERVVQSHRAFVKRRCWELALATKTQGAPSSARVMTTITIAPNGSVTSASATGGEGYPGLASCVAGQVRGWKFPASEGGTVNVPFVFAAQ